MELEEITTYILCIYIPLPIYIHTIRKHQTLQLNTKELWKLPIVRCTEKFPAKIIWVHLCLAQCLLYVWFTANVEINLWNLDRGWSIKNKHFKVQFIFGAFGNSNLLFNPLLCFNRPIVCLVRESVIWKIN